MTQETMLNLKHGRTVTVEPAGQDETLEVRSASGVVELRVKLTDDGVVLQLEGARISLKATESVDVECRTFTVNAGADVHVAAQGDVHVDGKIIHLN
jgi:phage gp45-like